MGGFIEDIEDTISLSGLQLEEDNISSSSSSSRSSFEQEFSGFFSEEWSHEHSYTTSPENIIFCGKIISSKPSVNSQVQKARTSALFRSSSDSFRFMKTASWQSTPRSKSLPNRLPSSSSCKSKWQVFIFGFGSGKFPTTMDISDIKSRQIRRQSTVVVGDGKEESGGRRSGKKSWWRLVEVLGCSGGYERDNMLVI
ncbi:hypothetical protein HanRHA438_Chr07g0318801 [Helianthus annuus]|nr:hypothetical protein HanRHA438_Chr07g0318801 [Helianthus annuus]